MAITRADVLRTLRLHRTQSAAARHLGVSRAELRRLAEMYRVLRAYNELLML